ncbi:MAG: hypothetical protein R2939_20000 [Kofleriaceae bacterium]
MATSVDGADEVEALIARLRELGGVELEQLLAGAAADDAEALARAHLDELDHRPGRGRAAHARLRRRRR